MSAPLAKTPSTLQVALSAPLTEVREDPAQEEQPAEEHKVEEAQEEPVVEEEAPKKRQPNEEAMHALI